MGYEALHSNTTGNNNTANGFQALYYNTTGNNNTANGLRGALHQHHRQQQHREWDEALYSNTTGSSNTANGYRGALRQHHRLQQHREWVEALFYNTTGNNNTANGYYAGQYIADGVTANQTSSNSVYEGYQAYPLASGDTNENVIGNTAIGHGSNTTTLGNASITDTYIAGSAHITSLSGLTTPLTVGQGGTGATTAAGALVNLGGVGSFTYAGTSAPSATCSALVNNGYIATNATPQAYQCTNATGSYAWNVLGSGGGGGGLSGMTTGQLPVAASATTVTSSIAYATANTASTIVERDGSGNFSAGTITAGATTPTTIGSNGVLLNGVPALQSQTSLNNYYSGGAGNLTGTGSNNTANGLSALNANTTGSNNTANGLRRSTPTPPATTTPRMGCQALYSNTTGIQQHREWVRGALHTTGINNTANGSALRQHHRLTTPRMGIRRDNTSRMA